MNTLKQLLAFPLYATVVWLVWVLGQQAGIDSAAKLLAALVVIAGAVWGLGHWAQAPGNARLVIRVVAVALIAGAITFAWPRGGGPGAEATAAAEGDWQPWSEAAVQSSMSQGHAVFVDFTAAWCVTCQVNKRLVLTADDVERRFAALDVVRLRADWTNRDAAITAALARMGRSGVPVYALYSPGKAEPALLPEVLTRGIVLEALQQAVALGASSYAMTSHSTKELP
jgi:thiol:disulfide interchange protein DsbD